ncbi:MAG: HAMP domain-containing sensor histidine kinase [Acutalibacteraceae bacterium]|nr:HAMP domain-containing sensor histidine kinase [Acutalibacteraceae bacterium]
MLKRLRRKFIGITMCSIVLVLGSIIGIINLANYWNINNNADALLSVLAENDGVFPRVGDMEGSGQKPPPRDMSPEAPFNTRYFTVVLRLDGTVFSVDTGRIAAVSSEEAAEYAAQLYAQGKTGGFFENYKYQAHACNEGIMYIFLDCNEELETFYSFLFVSILASLIGILLVFALVLFFSKLAVRPVAESYEKQKQFITDASHEIKTPLTVIDANTEVLEMESGENEWTKSIKNQVKRLASLTEKLVFLSRMEEENAALQMADFSLSEAILQTAQPYEAIAEVQGKTLSLEIERNVSYYGNEASLRQLISLLLDNAMKYSNPGGSIAVQFRTAGKNKVLSVKNTVSHIQKGKLDMLFERFYRLDSSRSSQTGGYGIGLSVARAIVTAHKGKISAQSDDGRSILFTIVL